MPVSRRRRIVRRAVLALAVAATVLGVGLAVVAMREPPEIQRSRALQLGMTRAEVEAVMGKEDGSWGVSQPPPGAVMVGGAGGNWPSNGMSFGKSIALKRRVFDWIGINPKVRHEDWPVHVRLDDDDHVDMIKRQGETRVEAPNVTNADE